MFAFRTYNNLLNSVGTTSYIPDFGQLHKKTEMNSAKKQFTNNSPQNKKKKTIMSIFQKAKSA